MSPAKACGLGKLEWGPGASLKLKDVSDCPTSKMPFWKLYTTAILEAPCPFLPPLDRRVEYSKIAFCSILSPS